MSWRRSGKRAHVEVVHRQVRLRDTELGGRLANLAGQRIRREPRRQRARRDRERDVPHLASGLEEAGGRAAAAELAVIGVRREHEGTAAASITASAPPYVER